MAQVVCSVCNAKAGGLLGASMWFYTLFGRQLCESCAAQVADATTAQMVVTTTGAVPGYQVVQYHGVESVEVFLDATGNLEPEGPAVRPYLGGASPRKGWEHRFAPAKAAAMRAIKVRVAERGGNALLGTTVSYMEFHESGPCVIVCGTSVTLAPIA